MADEDPEGAKEPEKSRFSFNDMYEELITIGRERREHIEKKVQSRKIGDIEAKMARWRLDRLREAAKVMKVLADGKSVEELKAEGWDL